MVGARIVRLRGLLFGPLTAMLLTSAAMSGIAAPPECLPNCAGADLSGTDLRWVNLSGANLTGADLSWADLSWSDLSEADLSGAELSWADLSGGILFGTALTDIEGCDLSRRLPSCVRGCAANNESDCATIVARFMKTFSDGDREKIANHIVFPLPREYPVPPIEREEFIDRYDEVFDDPLTSIISSSTLNDWSTNLINNRRSWMEWLDSRIYGPPIANYLTWDGGALSLEYSGKISWIYYSSEYETQERERLLRLRDNLIQEERRELHGSLREYETPILEWETETYRVRIDQLRDGKYRYAAWKVERSHADEPDLTLDNGEITLSHDTYVCGHELGGGHGVIYSFTSGEYLYEVDAGYCYVDRAEGAPGWDAYDPDVPEYGLYNLRVWRIQGRTALLPERGQYDFFLPKDHGYELILHEPFRKTENEIDSALYAEYRPLSR